MSDYMGGGGLYADPAAQQRLQRSRLAQALLQQGMDATPIRAHSQGLARLAQALMGGLELGAVNREAQDAKAQSDREVADYVSGGIGRTPPPATIAPVSKPGDFTETPTPAAPQPVALGAVPPPQAAIGTSPPPRGAMSLSPPPAPPVAGPAPAPGMYGRNAGAVAARDALADAPPSALAAASAERMPPGQPQYNPARPGADAPVPNWDAGLPAPTGRIAGLGAMPPPAAPPAAPPQVAPPVAPPVAPALPSIEAELARVQRGLASNNPQVVARARADLGVLQARAAMGNRDEDQARAARRDAASDERDRRDFEYRKQQDERQNAIQLAQLRLAIQQANRPPTTEERHQMTLLAPNADPASPQYAVAFYSLYGPRTVTADDGKTVTTIQPPIPPSIRVPPGFNGAGATPPGAASPGGAPAGPAPGTTTVPTAGNGSVTTTRTEAPRLTPAEVTLREETENALRAADTAINSLRDARRLSPQAYAGWAANTRAAVAGQTGLDTRSSTATTEFTSLMGDQVLSQLRAIFGGNPTEGERKILLDLQASATMSRDAREKLIDRAIDAAMLRRQQAAGRLQSVVRGDYGRADPNYTPPSPTQAPAAGAPTQAPVRVNSPEEARRLPRGTPILLPDGTQGVVP